MMPRIIWSTVVAVCLIALQPHALQGQDNQEQGVTTVTPDALEWWHVEREPEVRLAILYGNPDEAGHFVLRAKLPPSWAGRPQTHGTTLLVTVHSGTLYLAHGDVLTREAAIKHSPGTFVAIPAGTKVRAFTDEDGCVVDVQGEGPLTTQYLDEEAGEKN